MSNQILFETDRLYCRELTIDDWESFHDLQANPTVMKYTGTLAQNEEESRKDLEKVISHYKDPNDGFRVWAILTKDGNDLIGTSALISNEKGHELGYRLREQFWGNGYGTEIAKATMKYGFEQLGFDVIWAEVDQLNEGSVHVLDKTMNRLKAYWNERDQTNDFYYELTREQHEAK